MPDVLENHEGNVRIGGRTTCVTNLGLTIDIDGLAEKEQELDAPVEKSTQPAQGMK